MATTGTIDPASIPADWDDVTPEWMTAAINDAHPDAVVESVELLLRDDGTNRRARFGITYAAGSGPETVFVKGEAEEHREVHARNGNLFNEADLFSSGLTLPLDHARPYRVILDREKLDYVIVMEDLTRRHADPRDSTRPMTVAQVANGVRGLAKLHSTFWGFDGDSHPPLAWVQTWAPTEGFQFGLRRRTPTGLERAAGQLPVDVERFTGDELVDHWARFVTSLTTGPVTLLHGDPHIGNAYVLPDDDVGFLDWEVVRRGNWSHDVGYFVTGALVEAECRNHERELIEIYVDALDVPDDDRPTFDEAFTRYRASAAYGLAIWMSTLGTDGYQPHEISLLLCQRYGAAFVQLDTLGALTDLGV